MTIARYYPILDIATLARLGLNPVHAAAAMLEGGARLMQYRLKGHFTRASYDQAREIAKLCAQANARLIIDDRADIAALIGAGLHVGQDDLPPMDARRVIGPNALLGFSTHNPEQLAAASEEPLSYVAIGPVFATASKQNPDPVVGLDGVRAARRLVKQPLVAIGGITRENAARVFDAGADSVAVIGDALCDIDRLRKRTEEWIAITG